MLPHNLRECTSCLHSTIIVHAHMQGPNLHQVCIFIVLMNKTNLTVKIIANMGSAFIFLLVSTITVFKMSCKKLLTSWYSVICIFICLLSMSRSTLLVTLSKGMNYSCGWYPGLEAIIMYSLHVPVITTDEESSLSCQNLGSIFWSKLWWMNTPSSDSPPPCNASQHWTCQWLTPSIFFSTAWTVELWTLEFQNCLYAFLWEFVNGLTHKLGFGEKGC